MYNLGGRIIQRGLNKIDTVHQVTILCSTKASQSHSHVSTAFFKATSRSCHTSSRARCVVLVLGHWFIWEKQDKAWGYYQAASLTFLLHLGAGLKQPVGPPASSFVTTTDSSFPPRISSWTEDFGNN